MDKIGDNTETLTNNLNQLDIASTLESVNQTISNINNLTCSMDTKINGKDNSLGMLLNDRGVYDKLYETMNSANYLLLDLKNHPKRYVHFSVFGKKDK